MQNVDDAVNPEAGGPQRGNVRDQRLPEGERPPKMQQVPDGQIPSGFAVGTVVKILISENGRYGFIGVG